MKAKMDYFEYLDYMQELRKTDPVKADKLYAEFRRKQHLNNKWGDLKIWVLGLIFTGVIPFILLVLWKLYH